MQLPSASNWDDSSHDGLKSIPPPSTHQEKLAATSHYTASNPSLLWMVQQIEEADLGFIWTKSAFYHSESIQKYLQLPKEERLNTSRLPPDIRAALEKDVAQPVHDKLSRPWSPWWLLECIPLLERFITPSGEEWARYSYVPPPLPSRYPSNSLLKRVNFGRPRRIQRHGEGDQPLFHISVAMRQNADPTYRPRARFTEPPIYVDS